jgi:membrane-bound metal-dependent hydrolase YbcI (DUF457 family)
MANCKTHLLVGVSVALIADYLWQRSRTALDPNRDFDWGEFAVVGVCGASCGILADVLEPATNPNHRGFFHSMIFAGVLLWLLVRMSGRLTTLRCALGTMTLCYLSHLFLDCLTPRSLPLLGRWRCW